MASDRHDAPLALTDSESVIAVAKVAASPERIFDALTTSEIEQWWGSEDSYRVRNWRADLREGGRWSVEIVFTNRDGVVPGSGTFIALERGRKIVKTRRYDWDFPELGRRETLVTYRLDPVSNGTRVTVRQDRFAGLRGAAEQHALGWERYLGFLSKYFSAAAVRAGRTHVR